MDAVSLPCTIALGSPAAASLKAELQLLLAEIKRLGLQQLQLRQDVQDLGMKPIKNAKVLKWANPPGLLLRQSTYGSSAWSEAIAESPPVRNIISGSYIGVAGQLMLGRMPSPVPSSIT